ncbi:protein odr-4 homolog isoform X2 [Liolophura sinensis]|uniref:protein odr-4 homolog isoform X2 n=1 Tax=Liolophura sinensis TaxID=3198878 RepID=UPI0031583933
MGRLIFADESVQKYLSKLVADGSWNIGLVIGQQGQGDGSQRDYVIHVARTPEPVEDVADIESENEAEEEDSNKEMRSVPRPASLEDANELWVSTHAKQTTKMLPGGMSVIGLFAIAPPKMMEASQAKLRQLLYAVHRSVDKGRILQSKGQNMMDRILVQICSQTRKLTCRTLDVNYHLSTYRAAEWKYQSILDRFIRLETRVAINLSLPVPLDTAKQNLSKQIKTSLTPYCNNIWESLATVNKQMRNLDQTLEFTDSKKGRLTKGSTTHHKYVVDLFLSATSDKGITSGPVLSECGARMQISGAISGRAFVHNKATVNEGIEAIKQDVIRSLSSRCQLLCEDINVIEEDRANLHELYDTPKRVFAHVPGFPITFCDYAFKDETNKDIMERYSELLDIRLQEENLELEAESFLDDEDRDDMLKAEDSASCEGRTSAPPPNVDSVSHSSSAGSLLSEPGAGVRAIGVVASGALAAVIAGMSYLYLGTES